MGRQDGGPPAVPAARLPPVGGGGPARPPGAGRRGGPPPRAPRGGGGVPRPARRWRAAGVFEAMAHDLRAVIRVAAGRDPAPTAAIFDGRTVRSTPESGGRAGYDGYKRRRGSE